MELAESGTLFSYQNKNRVMGEAESFKFFSQTLSAIRYLHSQDIMHRDIKVNHTLLSLKIFFLIALSMLKFVIWVGLLTRYIWREKLSAGLMNTWPLKWCWKKSTTQQSIFGRWESYSMSSCMATPHFLQETSNKWKRRLGKVLMSLAIISQKI